MRTVDLFLGHQDATLLAESGLDEAAGDIVYYALDLPWGRTPVWSANYALLTPVRDEFDELAVRAVMEMPGRAL